MPDNTDKLTPAQRHDCMSRIRSNNTTPERIVRHELWHRGCPKYVVPKSNTEFWQEKVARNIARDEFNAQRLDTLAWTVITVWEYELTKKNLDDTVARIEAELTAAKETYEHYCAIRRDNREFARMQARKHRELLALVQAELNLPKSLSRYANNALVGE